MKGRRGRTFIGSADAQVFSDLEELLALHERRWVETTPCGGRELSGQTLDDCSRCPEIIHFLSTSWYNMGMAPEWLDPKFARSSDQDLRELQLRWARDDLWMRRVAFGATLLLVITVVGATALLRPQALLWFPAAGLVGPVAYYFGRARITSRRRTR